MGRIQLIISDTAGNTDGKTYSVDCVAPAGEATGTPGVDVRTPTPTLAPEGKVEIGARTLIDRGNDFYALGDYEAALAEYEEAISVVIDGTLAAIAHHNRGLTYNALGEIELALVDFRRALELNAQYATAYYNLAIIHDSLGNSELATTNYEQFLEFNVGENEFSAHARSRLEVLGGG